MWRNKLITGDRLPRHVGIIMDGNGRWAQSRALPRTAGHVQGAKRMKALVRRALELGVQHVTLYALSTENLKRPKEELEGLFNLFRAYSQDYAVETKRDMDGKPVRIRFLGETSLLPTDICESLKKLERGASGGEKSVNVALCYGSRGEIARAVNQAVERGTFVTEESLKTLLYTRDLPDVDLVIRTGKEMRLSNFLLYQSAYAELYFSKKCSLILVIGIWKRRFSPIPNAPVAMEKRGNK